LIVISSTLFLVVSLTIPLTVVASPTYSPEQVAVMSERAENTVREAYKLLWDLKMEYHRADAERDTGHTGVIGVEYSALTSTLGYEDAKELSTKPGWASWLVKQLAERGIWEHAEVGVSMTGSFPALNIAVLATLQELHADVKCISSIGASSYGANEIGFSWPEIERLLREEGILKVGSSAVTLGGTGDRGAEWNGEAMDLALRAVKRSLLPLIKPVNLRDGVTKRMLFYGDATKYFCFINVGGSQATLGAGAVMRFNRGGWFLEPLALKGDPNGVMDSFLDAGVPCLNLLFLRELNLKENILRP